MYSHNSSERLFGLLFVAIFVLQQIVAFVWKPFIIVAPYWILVTIAAFVIGLKLPIKKYSNTNAFKFALVCAICSLPTLLNGTTPGEVVVKIIYIIIAFFGYILLSENRISLGYFDVLLIGLYVYYYYVYFSLGVANRILLDPDLFGHSSSNTIAISLNMVLWLYFLLNSAYDEKHSKRIFLFSLINLVLIVVQGSRAGIIVALLLSLLSLSDCFTINGKWKRRLLYLFVFGGAVYMIIRYLPALENVVDVANMAGLESYENDARSMAQAAFFKNMDLEHALIGYDYNHKFAGDISRTFNAFLDFWKTYGLLPMLFLIIAVVGRISRRNHYNIPLLYLTPIFAYSFVESIWGGTLWDVVIFISLFGFKNNEY